MSTSCKLILMKHWPLISALCILLLTVGILFFSIGKNTGGHYTYSLDDPYIHMAVAKNLSESGNWGITKYEFSSSSSSLLWTLLLSGTYSMFGVNEFSPLIINILAAAISVFVLYLLFMKLQPAPPRFYVLASLVAIIFLAELPSLIFTGMEHSLQILIVILFVHFSSRVLSEEKNEKSYTNIISLLALSLMVTFIRYEGISLIFIVSILFILRGRWGLSIAIALLGFIPSTTYGLISTSNGGYWLPNTVLIKAGGPNFTSLYEILVNIINTLYRIMLAPEILLLIFTSLALYIMHFNKRGHTNEYKRNFLIIFFLTALLQSEFSSIGQVGSNVYFYRYEAYCVVLGLLAIFFHLYEYLPNTITTPRFDSLPKYLAIFLIVLFPVVSFSPGWWNLSITPQASYNIYEQQYQMGLFLKRFYQGKTVALNDIGAANYLCDLKCIDLAGLGSNKVAKIIIKNKATGAFAPSPWTNLSTEQISDLTQNADIAICYDSWFPNVPPSWVKVGEWVIQNNVVSGGNTVSFYAINAFEKDNLLNNLRIFSAKLPNDVRQGHI